MTDAATAPKRKRATKTKGNQSKTTNVPQGGTQNVGIVRYSEDELTEFKELVQRKLGAAKKEHAYHINLANGKDPMASGSEGYLTMDTATIGMEKDFHNQMASRQFILIQNLEAALVRIENKTYGICRTTGKLIDKGRLRAVPHTTQCIEAKMSLGK